MAAISKLPVADPPSGEPFWKTKSLAEMSPSEWESLCDGCGRCCLVKLEDEDTGKIHYTDVGCTLLDGQSCACRNYPERQIHVPDCVRLTPDVVESLSWLPRTCAYKLLADKRDLYWWHPLVSGDPETVHQAGISVQDRLAGPEEAFLPDELVDHVVTWPLAGAEAWVLTVRRGAGNPSPAAIGSDSSPAVFDRPKGNSACVSI